MIDYEDDWIAIRGVAQAILDERLGVVEGCRMMAREINRCDLELHPLFEVFVAVESETDDLPAAHARRLWSSEALARKEASVAQYIEKVKAHVFEACRLVILTNQEQA